MRQRVPIDGPLRAPDDAGMGTRKVVGCMTGTSIDGLDAALVEIEGRGLGMRTHVERCVTRSLGLLGAPLRGLAALEPMSARQIAVLARDFALLHVDAVRELLSGQPADLIAVHGQTVYHAPPLSWQLFNPAPLAHALQTPVVCDLRAADLAAGGQGAHDPESWVATSVGGDICACNQLLDALSRTLFNEPFDAGGAHAACGTVQSGPRDELLTLLRAQADAGRSLGTGDELGGWIARHRDQAGAADLARSACDAIATVVIETVEAAASRQRLERVQRYLLAGGSVNHRVLYDALAERTKATVQPTSAYGVPPEYREAAAMAILGALCQDRVPITLPEVTGVKPPAPMAGLWVYPDTLRRAGREARLEPADRDGRGSMSAS